MADRTCSECGGPLRTVSKTGVCRRNAHCRLVSERITQSRRPARPNRNGTLPVARASDKRRSLTRRTARRSRKRDLVLAEKLARGCCCDCGFAVTNANWMAFDFDHRDPATKHRAIATMTQNGETVSSLIAEMAKCDLRCSNCHRIRTYADGHQNLGNHSGVGQPRYAGALTLFEVEPMTSPAPDTSADWGYNDHSVDSAGGLDIGKATAPGDPMHFLPNDGAPISGSPSPLSGELAGGADWGYPNDNTQHGTHLDNP